MKTMNLKFYPDHINAVLLASLPEAHQHIFHKAMHYCVFNGGKRLRPLFIYLTGEVLGLSLAQLDPLACAIELIHCYSLVHDDLPAMDNAPLRRGKPSCHKKYDEATAILAGDALFTLAFEVIARAEALTDTQKIKAIQILTACSGAQGMVKGQILDLQNTNISLSPESLMELYSLKTGQLLMACVKLPALIKNLSSEEENNLFEFARHLGLGYQIQDDLLDIESDTSQLGKTAGIDQKNLKKTFPMVIGILESKQKLQELQTRALHCLNTLPFDTRPLKHFTHCIFNRKT